MPQVGFLVGIVGVIAVATHFGLQPSRAGQGTAFLWIGVPTVVLAALGVIRAHRDGTLGDWFRVKSGDFTRGFGAAALLFGAAFLVTKSLGLPRILWVARAYEQLGDAADLRKRVALVVVGIVVTAIAEEILWRGLVTSLLEEKIGSRRAWVWAAVLYAVAQVPSAWALSDPNAGPNPLLIVAALGCGLVWGFMARRFERLLPSIFSHLLFSWTVMMMFRLWGPSV